MVFAGPTRSRLKIRQAGATSSVTRTDDLLELRAPSGRLIRIEKFRHPMVRYLRLSVTARGARVSCPRGVSATAVAAFVHQHGGWLEEQMLGLDLLGPRHLPLRAGIDNRILWRDQELPLRWRRASIPHAEDTRNAVLLHLPQPWGPRSLALARQLLWQLMEDTLRRDLARWLPVYAERLGRVPGRIRIRPMQSQWGSLGVRGQMNLNLTLIHAPREVARYVFIHELAHLVERNHGPRFWRQVERLMPRYEARRDWLAQHGTRLRVEAERLLSP